MACTIDVDANGHARHTAYSEYATDACLHDLAECGFTPARFQALRLGPILFTEQLEYRRELSLGDEVVATVTVAGAWLDLDQRRLVTPPDGLRDALTVLPRTPPAGD